MSKGTGNGKAPAWSADALWDAVEDAVLSGSVDAGAEVERLLARGKPVYRKTKVRLRNAHRKVRAFDTALDAAAVLRRAWDASRLRPAAGPVQMALPLARNGNGAISAPDHRPARRLSGRRARPQTNGGTKMG